MSFRIALVTALAVVGAVQESAFAASAEHGKAAFMQHGCWQCHGTMGQGSIMTSGGKRLAPDPLPWEAFSAFVRSSNRSMPPFSETILSDSDLADIYAYLQSIPKPPDPNSIPLLKQ
ncbi:MAG TPA: cytochrome c [Pseudolabrys sp.]|nr:cytochrome c [Pseudolabrys sp.]